MNFDEHLVLIVESSYDSVELLVLLGESLHNCIQVGTFSGLHLAGRDYSTGRDM